MKVVQVSRPGGDFELVERPVPDPGRGQVRIRVEACGICHSDLLVKEGHWPGLQYARVPGHEIAGRVDAVGPGVTQWKPGQRAGVGWHGGHCFICDPCRRGEFIVCQNEEITALSFDGGYAEYMIAPAEAVAAIPDMVCPPKKPLPCSAPASRPTTRCGTPGRCRVIWLRFWASAAWDTSESSKRARRDSAPSPSVVGQTKKVLPENLAPMNTLITAMELQPPL